jgi:4-hydroxybenzoate polyprenyltransferase
VIKIAERYIALIRNSKAPIENFCLTFLAVVTLRNFVEIFSDRSEVSVITFSGHLHFYLFYICIALTMILLFSLATREAVNEVSRLILFSFFFILLAPAFDLIFSLGQGYDMAYLLPHEHGGLLLRYLTFGGSSEGGGITTGLKLEGIIILAASFLYFKAKRVSTLRSLFFVLAIYTIVFVYAMAPFIVKASLDVWGLFEGFDDALMIRSYLVLATVLLLILAWKWNPDHFLGILRGMRPFRQAHAVLMFACGVAMGPSFAWGQNTPLDLALTALSIVCACLCVIAINNLEKEPRAPFGGYRKVAIGTGLLALVYAGAVSYYTVLTVSLCMGLYFLYALPPLRIKRVPLLSKVPAALGSLACVILGHMFAGGEVIEFPPLVILWFLVPFFAALNLIDIKDYDIDRRAGIQTLPALWGLGRSKWIIGLFLLFAYVTAPLAFGLPFLLLPALGVGIIQCFLVTREQYQERWVFAVYLLSLVVLLVSMIWSA